MKFHVPIVIGKFIHNVAGERKSSIFDDFLMNNFKSFCHNSSFADDFWKFPKLFLAFFLAKLNFF